MHPEDLPVLNIPPATLSLRQVADGTLEVYDPLRRMWLVLTPEEWVRQNFVAMMCRDLGYPPALMANEVGLRLNGTLRRCDTVVYDKSLRPAVIVEYKAPSVAVTQKVFDQIARYNLVLGARLLIVSNGLRHYCCRIHPDGSYTFLRNLPCYGEILSQE